MDTTTTGAILLEVQKLNASMEYIFFGVAVLAGLLLASLVVKALSKNLGEV